MFIDEIKILRAGGARRQRLCRVPSRGLHHQGRPSGGNGRDAAAASSSKPDHDLNNLIGQYYVPRLIAPPGEGAWARAWTVHAGQGSHHQSSLRHARMEIGVGQPLEKIEDEDEDRGRREVEHKNPFVSTGTSQRPVFARDRRHSRHGSGLVEGRRGEKNFPSLSPRAKSSPTSRRTASNSFYAKADAVDGQRNSPPPRARHRVLRSRANRRRRRLSFGTAHRRGNRLVRLSERGQIHVAHAISKARPKVAAYPFTTLHPQIGSSNTRIGSGSRSATCRDSSKARIQRRPRPQISAPHQALPKSCAAADMAGTTTASRGTITNNC